MNATVSNFYSMISRQELKHIRSLHQKKRRDETGLFLVEGEKSLAEVLRSLWEVELVLATTDFLTKYPAFKISGKRRILEVDPQILQQAGSLETNDTGLAVVRKVIPGKFSEPRNRFTLVAEDISDPGNLGSLMRIADWYGIGEILLSENSVEVYNPKVIQASMGSFLRVTVHYGRLAEIFSQKKIPLIGTFPEGDNLYDFRFPAEGYLLLGNESKGISDELMKYLDARLAIPRFGNAESLNVAVAAAVILDNLKRKP